jgi:NAD(P)-dependent dehydrogenase (short-subunit alcohol dehydrogenase family)
MTGAAGGTGLAAALRFPAMGLKVCLADLGHPLNISTATGKAFLDMLGIAGLHR